MNKNFLTCCSHICLKFVYMNVEICFYIATWKSENKENTKYDVHIFLYIFQVMERQKIKRNLSNLC